MSEPIKDKEKWICTRCKWEGHVDDIIKEKSFIGNTEEPEEWQWFCPDCKYTEHLEEYYEHCAWCRTCEDVIVSDEDEQCTECATCEAEARADEARGH